MPPRLSKRQQRELQEQLLAVRSPAEAQQDSGEEIDDDAPVSKATNLFGALDLAEEETPDKEDDGEDEDDQSAFPAKARSKKKSKKKKKKVASALGGEDTPGPSSVRQTDTPTDAGPSTPQQSAKKKKKVKKDEIDQALEELGKKHPELRAAGDISITPPIGGTHATTTATRLRALLQVSYKDLDPSVELRRFFGSRVIAQNSSPQNRRHATPLRSRLTKPQDNWPAQNTRQGISIRELDEAEVQSKMLRDGRQDGVRDGRWWTAEHSRAYKMIQQQFLQAVGSHDPNNMVALLQVYPWHVDTLLQLSNVATHQGDLTLASEFIERAIFAFERCFVPAFNLSTGGARLDFDRIENRPFFMALSKYVQHLLRRGCPRTGFEFARLLLSLDPVGDPHGASLLLDYLSVKAGMGSWLVEMWDVWEQATNCTNVDEGLNVTMMPGWAYARALALYDGETNKADKEHAKASEALRHAIVTFPWVVPVLCDKASLTLSGDARAHPLFRIETAYSRSDSTSTLHLLSHLYALRSSVLWKNEPYANWLTRTVTSILPTLSEPSASRSRAASYFQDTPEWICRHIICADLNSLFTFLPPPALRQIGMMYDPLPPDTAYNTYDDHYFESGDGRPGIREFGPEGAGDGIMAFREYLQRVLGGEGGNGDVMDMMVQQAIMDQAQQEQARREREGQAPGAWDGPDIAEQANGDENENGPEAGNAGAGGGLRGALNNILGRFWATRPPLEDAADAEEEDGYLTDNVEDVD